MIDLSIRRKDMMQIGARRRLAVEPALRPRMLAVVAVALAGVVAALVAAESEIVGGRGARTIGVHVPHFAVVGTYISSIECLPQLIV